MYGFFGRVHYLQQKTYGLSLNAGCHSISRFIESIAVFKVATGLSCFCFVQSSHGCITKNIDLFAKTQHGPVETWRVFLYIASRMMSLKMLFVSADFKFHNGIIFSDRFFVVQDTSMIIQPFWKLI